MKNRPELFIDGGAESKLVLVVRKDGSSTPFNAGDAVAAVVDILSLHNVKVPPTLRARLGKAAKVCLEDGFTPELVVRALVTAARRARVDLVEQILLEQQLTESGLLLSGYRQSLTASQIIDITRGWK